MKWTQTSLQTVKLPYGQTKLSLADPEVPNLYFEVRKRSRSFVFRMTRDGETTSKTIGQFPETSIVDARRAARHYRNGGRAIGAGSLKPKSQGHTLDQFVEEYFKKYTTNRHKESAANLALYSNHIQPVLGHKRLSEIDMQSVHAWMEALLAAGYKNSTVNRITILFGQIIGLAERLDVPGAPERRRLHLRSLPVRPTHTVFLKPNQAERLVVAVKASPNPDLADIVMLLLITGARKREALNMRWDNVDFLNRILTVPMSKSGRPRYILLADNALALLQRRYAQFPGTEFVFTNPKTGRPYRCFFNSWKAAREEAGLPELRVHDLRHSYASALVNSGVPLYDVQHLLGHSSIKTTQRYAHLSQDRLQASARRIDAVYRDPALTDVSVSP